MANLNKWLYFLFLFKFIFKIWFNLDFKFLEKDDLSKVTTYNQTGNAHDFDEQFFNLPDNTNLHWFFQNLKYFDHNQEQIKKEFSFKESVQIKCKQYLNDIIDNNKPVVSVHLRRPDNKNIRLNQHSINYYTKTSINLAWSLIKIELILSTFN